MASIATIRHRFANKDFGRNGQLQGSHNSIIGRNYYSYSTVFGQWVDTEKNVCIVYWGSTSQSSYKHQLRYSDFPSDVNVFPYDDGGTRCGYSNWHGCRLIQTLCNTSDDTFTFDHRVKLMDYWTNEIYSALADINGGTSKGLIERAERTIDTYLPYYYSLFRLYGDVSFNKYLKVKRANDKKEWKRKNTMIKLLADEADVKTIVDTLFGNGVYDDYYNRCSGFRKSDETRKKMGILCERLGICNPYYSWNVGRLDSGLSAKEIRKLTAKERNDLHFASIMYNERYKEEGKRKEKYNKNFRNAYKWIVGCEPKKKSWGGDYESIVHNNCINKDNSVVYECSGEHIYRAYWCDTDVSFDYDEFRKSENKEQWIADFYAKCKEVADNRKAISVLRRINARTAQKARPWDDDVYLNDDYLRENTTEEEYAVCAEFIRRQDKYFADEEARRRAAEILRLRREEAERKEREYREQVKQEQIDECLENGIEGCRDLWRKHLMDINYAERETNYKGDFFYGGNVLLRFNLNKDKVETSKEIRIPVELCKKMWKIISKWHENPKCFKPMKIDTMGSGRYTISSYENDILTAGCHKIAYTEMERMYNEIVKLENEAV